MEVKEAPAVSHHVSKRGNVDVIHRDNKQPRIEVLRIETCGISVLKIQRAIEVLKLLSIR